MNRTSRIFRTLGSTIFTAAGGFYVLAPPTTTSAFFDSSAPAIAWGWVFAVGGVVSLSGTLTGIVHVERLGVLFVIVAAAMLTAGQTMVMFGAEEVTWTRGGGTLVTLGFAFWAFERWWKLGRDERAINDVADAR